MMWLVDFMSDPEDVIERINATYFSDVVKFIYTSDVYRNKIGKILNDNCDIVGLGRRKDGKIYMWHVNNFTQAFPEMYMISEKEFNAQVPNKYSDDAVIFYNDGTHGFDCRHDDTCTISDLTKYQFYNFMSIFATECVDDHGNNHMTIYEPYSHRFT